MPAPAPSSSSAVSVASRPVVDASCSEASHEALKANLPGWCALRLDSYWHHAGLTYELRACPVCDSTLMQRVEFIEVRYPDRVAA